MPRQRPGIERTQRRGAVARPGIGLDVAGAIVDSADRDPPLLMEHLGSPDVGLRRASTRESWQARLDREGQIAEDWMDGVRVYAQPPRRHRPIDRIGRLRVRATPRTWPFLLLALAQATTLLLDAWISGAWSLFSILSLVGGLGYSLCLTLLPAGVLIWRPDAWRSARSVLVGTILWTSAPAVAGLVLWIARQFPHAPLALSIAVSAVVAVAAVVSCTGPAIVALGLERSRRYRDSWIAEVVRWAVVAAVVVAPFNAVQWLPPANADYSPILLARSYSGWVLPFQTAGLFILAYSCVFAVLVDEVQRRLWQFGAAGAGLLVLVSFNQMVNGWLIGVPGQWDPAGRGWPALSSEAALLVGSGLLLLGLASPVWSLARDAVLSGRAAPEEVFTWGPAAEFDAGQPLPMTAIVAVAAGKDHSLALDTSGHVGAWGDNSLGQIDVPKGLSDAVAIAAGDGFSLVLRAGGTVAAWGANDRGQTDVPGDIGAVMAIAAGGDFALALGEDGTVVGWGDGASGVVPVPAGLGGVIAVSAGEAHAVALRRNGTVVAWGDDTYNQMRVPAGVTGATAISAGGFFSLALLADGTVVAWGDNTYGQLDVPEGLRNVTAVSAGVFHAVALRADGDLVAWGGGGRRGEDHPWRLVDFKAVAAGDGFSLALRAT
jgi:hypothetical protein